MTSKNEFQRLIQLLDKAEEMLAQYSGGYSGEFFSAEDFHQALYDKIKLLKAGDELVLKNIYDWFVPSSCWNDFVGKEGTYLGNQIYFLCTDLLQEKAWV